MSSPVAEVLAQMFEMSTNSTAGVAEKVPPAKRFKQLKPGKAHPLWLVGHIANTNNAVLNMWCLNKDPLVPREWGKIFAPDFAGGGPIVADAATYPDWDTVLAEYKKVAAACTAGIRLLTDEELAGPLRGNAPEPMQKMFNPVSKCIRAMCGHDSHHRGQLAMLSALD